MSRIDNERPYGVTYYRNNGAYNTPQGRFATYGGAVRKANELLADVDDVKCVDVWKVALWGRRRLTIRLRPAGTP